MSNGRLACICLCLTSYSGLAFSYAWVESQLFDDILMEYHPPAPWAQVLSAIMAVVPAFYLPLKCSRPSEVCLWGLYLLVVQPMMFIPYHVVDRPAHAITVLPAAVLASFLVTTFLLRVRVIQLPNSPMSPQVTNWLIYGSLAFLMVVVWRLNGSFRLNLSLDNIYDRRLTARDEVSNGSLLAYAVATLTYAVAPVGLLVGYTRRQYAMGAMAILSLLFVFSYRATKTDLVMPFFIVGLCYIVSNPKRPFGIVAPAGVCFILGLSLTEFFLLETPVISGYVVRRQFMVPSLLTSFYWDFFSTNPLVLYSDKSYGSFFVGSRYNIPLTRLIGYEYFNNYTMNANTCFWASAFANLGYVGILLATVLLSAMLSLFDAIANQGNRILCLSMAGLLAVQLSNGALENCVVTGGVAVSFALLYCLGRSNANERMRLRRPAQRTMHYGARAA